MSAPVLTMSKHEFERAVLLRAARWAWSRLGALDFRAVKGCSRCTVSTLGLLNVQKSKEPLRMLARYRRWDGEVWFGMNLISDGTGPLALSDPLTLLEPGGSHG